MSVLQAPPHWRAIDFISDLHLQESEPATLHAWRRYMAQSTADAVFILGDLFEVWVGDDAAQPGSFEAQCADTLNAAAQRRAVYFMPGNRDFLVGSAYMAQCGATLLADPTVLVFADQRWLLTHGDALCIDDTDYMAFRAQVRRPDWQASFLSQPLTRRKAIARDFRAQSEALKQISQRSGAVYADVDAALARAWLTQAGSQHMLHGHTHKPAHHALGQGMQRTVLPDWDWQATPPRGHVLRLSTPAAGTGPATLERLALPDPA